MLFIITPKGVNCLAYLDIFRLHIRGLLNRQLLKAIMSFLLSEKQELKP
jgi:hypothetical protein